MCVCVCVCVCVGVGVCLLTDTLRADTEWHIKVLPLVAVSKKNCHVIHTVVW